MLSIHRGPKPGSNKASHLHREHRAGFGGTGIHMHGRLRSVSVCPQPLLALNLCLPSTSVCPRTNPLDALTRSVSCAYDSELRWLGESLVQIGSGGGDGRDREFRSGRHPVGQYTV
jgi:hypothetical protein